MKSAFMQRNLVFSKKSKKSFFVGTARTRKNRHQGPRRSAVHVKAPCPHLKADRKVPLAFTVGSSPKTQEKKKLVNNMLCDW